jgi:post-segregation antitoxin (ccd killing protein)
MRMKSAASARAGRWLEENRLALDSSNAFLARFGLPLKSLRLF